MEFFLNFLRSVAYGIIEGVTEWLPISSTGHMILAEQVLKFSFSAEFMEMFRVVIQLGAILAVVVLYFKKLWPFCADNGRDSGFSRHFRWPVVRLWCKIIVACVPAAVLGLRRARPQHQGQGPCQDNPPSHLRQFIADRQGLPVRFSRRLR